MKTPYGPLLACVLATIVASPAVAQEWVPYGDVLPTAHTLSPELRSLPNAPAHVGAVSDIPIRHRPSFVPGVRPSAPDPVAQTTPGSALNTSSGIGFDGVAFNGYYPPDPNISVGDTQIVQTTNVELAVYDKGGTLLKGPVSLSSLFSGLSNLCSTTNGGDPIVLWDKIAHRWLISQLAFTSNLQSNYVCIAVSQGNDATGAYNVYAFSSSRLPDYPKFGVWSSSDTDGASDYYLSANLFSTSFYYGPLVCAFNGGDMQAGRTARFACVQGTTSHFSLLPADVDGGTAPAKGEPNYFVELGTGISSTSGNTLKMQAFKATWTTTGGSLNAPSTITLSVPAYALACGNGGTCIPQPQTSTQLDSLGDRLMYRLAFRKTTDHETLLVNHSVDRGDGTVGLRWYEIHSNSGTTLETSQALFQSGTYSPDAAHRWMGSIAEDKNGDIAVGYSASSGVLYPSILYSGRAAGSSDAPGTLGTESVLQQGSGSETGASRWGDYTSLSLDPQDDCTFWYTNEYFSGSSSYSWRTRIASFSFSGCGTTTTKTATTTTLTSSLNPSNVGDVVTFTTTVAPTGATGSVQFFDGLTSLGIATLSGGTASLPTSALTAGSHSITAAYSGDGTYSSSTSAVLTQTVNDNTPPATGSFTLTASSSSVTVARNGSTQFTITVTPANGFASDVSLSASGVPPQSSITFSPATVTGGNGPSAATISIGRNTPRKAYTMTIIGTGGGVTATATVTVNVR